MDAVGDLDQAVKVGCEWLTKLCLSLIHTAGL